MPAPPLTKEEMDYFFKHRPPSSEYSLSQIAKSMKNIESLLEAVVDALQKFTDEQLPEE